MSSVIIEHLSTYLQQFPNDQSSGKIAYLYLSFKVEHSIEHLLGSIIKQVVQDETELPDRLVAVYRQQQERGNEPPTSRDLSILLADISRQKPVYIIVDALDECQRETRNSLVELMQPSSFKNLSLSILITSRLLDEFQKLAKGFERVNIQAHNTDIDLFIDREFARDADLQEFATRDPKLQDDVKNAVRLKSDGMWVHPPFCVRGKSQAYKLLTSRFLLATMHIQSLAKQPHLAGIRQSLKELPEGIDATYDRALKRIINQAPERKKLALDTFAWLIHSQGQLSLTQLLHALATDGQKGDFDPQRITNENTMRDVCGGLIAIQRDTVTFVHYTAQTYFTTHTEELFVGVHARMAEVCIYYLCIPALEQPDDEEQGISFADDLYDDPHTRFNTLEVHRMFEYDRDTPSQPNEAAATGSVDGRTLRPPRLNFTTKCEKFPFVRYAARNLGYHLRQSKDSTIEERTIGALKTLLQNRAKRNFLLRLLWTMDLYGSAEWRATVHDSSTISTPSDVSLDSEREEHAAGEALLEIILERLGEKSTRETIEHSDEGSDENDSDLEAAHVAGDIADTLGFVKAVEVHDLEQVDIIEQHTLPDDIDTIVPQQAHSQIPSQEEQAQRTLVSVADPLKSPGEEDGMGVQPIGPRSAQTPSLRRDVTPLHLAAFFGCAPIVRTLITENCNLDALDFEEQPPIVVAIQQGHLDVVALLLENGARFDLLTAAGQTALLTAAQDGRPDVVRMIVSKVLHRLQESNQSLEYGERNVRQNVLFLYLLAAIELFLSLIGVSHPWLGATSIQPLERPLAQTSDSTDYHLRVIAAAGLGDVEAMSQSLLQAKALSEKNISNVTKTAMFLAVEFGHVTAAQTIIENGANIDAIDNRGNAVLHRAAIRNDVEMVEMLLKHTPKIDKLNNDGRTVWALAAGRLGKAGE